jgi:hypothetical protein
MNVANENLAYLWTLMSTILFFGNKFLRFTNTSLRNNIEQLLNGGKNCEPKIILSLVSDLGLTSCIQELVKILFAFDLQLKISGTSAVD